MPEGLVWCPISTVQLTVAPRDNHYVLACLVASCRATLAGATSLSHHCGWRGCPSNTFIYCVWRLDCQLAIANDQHVSVSFHKLLCMETFLTFFYLARTRRNWHSLSHWVNLRIEMVDTVWWWHLSSLEFRHYSKVPFTIEHSWVYGYLVLGIQAIIKTMTF